MFVTKNLYQNDDAWKNTPLGHSRETIGSWGCLLTSVTMMLNGIGYNETPVTVNEKMKKAGGFQGALFIPSVLPYVWSHVVYRGMQPCETAPAPLAQIDAAAAQGKPVILQVDWSKQAGLQTHFVLVKERKGNDYSIYDPYKYSGDAPDREVLLTQRYKFNGAKLETEISAALWFENYAAAAPEPPKVQKVPVPADALKLYAAADDLALRAEPSVTGYLWKRMRTSTELTVLEPRAQARSKVGVNGQWIQAQDPEGDQGYVAAWYVSEQKNASPSTPVSAPVSPSTSTPKPPPRGALALYPTEELSFRSKPVISAETLIRRLPVTEQLTSLEPTEQTIAKVGVVNQWLKVQDGNGQEGYVAAWYVKYAGGASAQAAGAVSGAEGGVKVRTTAEAVSLRSQPFINDATLIKRVPINHEFTIAEAGGESKIGANNQWVKVRDAAHEGYVAAWFLRR
jgi:uncharacterized protein YgiM (DUF1202 family)